MASWWWRRGTVDRGPATISVDYVLPVLEVDLKPAARHPQDGPPPYIISSSPKISNGRASRDIRSGFRAVWRSGEHLPVHVLASSPVMLSGTLKSHLVYWGGDATTGDVPEVL